MKRRAKLLLASSALAAGGILALAGAVPQGFESVSSVLSRPEEFYGREVHVKAVVGPEIGAAGDTSEFEITDGQRTLPVRFPGSLPEGFSSGRTVVVAGVLAPGDQGPVLEAHDIQGGCASRYEPKLG